MKVTFTDALIKGCSGKLDNNSEFYFRYNKRTGTTSLCRRPHRKTTTMNPKQTAQQKRFKRMIALSKEIMTSPNLRQLYYDRWLATGKTPYSTFAGFVAHCSYHML